MKFLIFGFLLSLLLLIPVADLSAQTLINCGSLGNPCNIREDFFGYGTTRGLVDIVTHFALYTLLPIFAGLSFGFIGFRMIIAGGKPAKMSEEWGLFKAVGLGFVTAFASWLVVHEILKFLVDPKVLTDILDVFK